MNTNENKNVGDVGLTDERIDKLWRNSTSVGGNTTQQFVRHFARCIEREVLADRPAHQAVAAEGVNVRDLALRSRVADLIHLTQFYPNISEGDEKQAQKAIIDIKAMLATPISQEAEQMGGAQVASSESVDTPELEELLVEFHHGYQYGPASRHDAAKAALIAHITSLIAARVAKSEAGFKNFHRSLCKRFGYTHDEQDWWRDQVSLEEHIAAQVAEARKDAERWRWFVKHGFFWRGLNCLQTCWPKHGEIGVKNPEDENAKESAINAAIDAAMNAEAKYA